MTPYALLVGLLVLPQTQDAEPARRELRTVNVSVSVLEISGAAPVKNDELTAAWVNQLRAKGKIVDEQVYQLTTLVGTTARMQVGKTVSVVRGQTRMGTGRSFTNRSVETVGRILEVEPVRATDKAIELRAYVESTEMLPSKNSEKEKGDIVPPEKRTMVFESTVALQPGKPVISRATTKGGTDETHFVIMMSGSSTAIVVD